jgi:uncharacterized protein (TIGR00375 family)
METDADFSSLVFADLHIHSKYSRAVSEKMTLEGLYDGSIEKGLGIVATGDFTHPRWFSELTSKLVPSESEGLFTLKGKDAKVRYMISTEVATICSLGPAGVKKVHHIVYVPGLEQAAQINDRLSKMGNLAADGRPMFGNCTSAQMAEIIFEASKDAVIVPAHVWTPWFSALGSNSGYDSIDAAYEDQAKRIFAIESGLSSDPAMNWRLSSMDRFAIMSNSDSHSPYSWRLGRECNAFSIASDRLSYASIWKAVKDKDPSKFAFTVEVDPNYGKYHYDGHRLCGVCFSPEQTAKLKGICPVCKKPLTIGVQYRVDELADRPDGFVPKGALPYKKLLPLNELISAVIGSPLASKKVAAEYGKLIAEFKSELSILIDVPAASLSKVSDEKIVSAIIANRNGKLVVSPGYDGEYGQITAFGSQANPKAKKAAVVPNSSLSSQKSLDEFC